MGLIKKKIFGNLLFRQPMKVIRRDRYKNLGRGMQMSPIYWDRFFWGLGKVFLLFV